MVMMVIFSLASFIILIEIIRRTKNQEVTFNAEFLRKQRTFGGPLQLRKVSSKPGSFISEISEQDIALKC
jgi:hypothetical protein